MNIDEESVNYNKEKHKAFIDLTSIQNEANKYS